MQVLPSNVSREADSVFMLELKRTDPKRYAKLERNIRCAAYRKQAMAVVSPPTGLCRRTYANSAEAREAKRVRDRLSLASRRQAKAQL